MVEVAVIGAGAAGLVASRHLLGNGLRPLIFESSKAVGGEYLVIQVYCSSSSFFSFKMFGKALEEDPMAPHHFLFTIVFQRC